MASSVISFRFAAACVHSSPFSHVPETLAPAILDSTERCKECNCITSYIVASRWRKSSTHENSPPISWCIRFREVFFVSFLTKLFYTPHTVILACLNVFFGCVLRKEEKQYASVRRDASQRCALTLTHRAPCTAERVATSTQSTRAGLELLPSSSLPLPFLLPPWLRTEDLTFNAETKHCHKQQHKKTAKPRTVHRCVYCGSIDAFLCAFAHHHHHQGTLGYRVGGVAGVGFAG